jgi:hypothetical protein
MCLAQGTKAAKKEKKRKRKRKKGWPKLESLSS